MAPPALCIGSALTIVAHPDDDLLFLNPDILRDIEAGRCARTVFVTAGEAGEGPEYWSSLEDGIRATYAQMAGVADDWIVEDAGVTWGAIWVYTLADAPHVSVVFLRLPDGFDGNGSAAYGWESLEKLWDGSIETITTVDGEEWYTGDQVRDVLVQIMTNFEPTTVRVQDWTTDPANLDDHSDHRATALFAHLASGLYSAPHSLLSYEGYPIWNFDQNVFDDELTRITDAFVKFAEYDKYLCSNPFEGCPSTRTTSGWRGSTTSASSPRRTQHASKGSRSSPPRARRQRSGPRTRSTATRSERRWMPLMSG